MEVDILTLGITMTVWTSFLTEQIKLTKKQDEQTRQDNYDNDLLREIDEYTRETTSQFGYIPSLLSIIALSVFTAHKYYDYPILISGYCFLLLSVFLVSNKEV